MRGGRNKFGPMYKHDRALKQQRKALIEASGLRIEGSPLLVSSTHHRDFSFTGGLNPVPMLQSTTLPMGENDCLSYQLPSLPSTQYQYTSPNWTIKSERINNCASPQGPAAGVTSDSSIFSPQSPRIPHLVMELLRCDPDELQLQNKITAHLLQEQMGREKHKSTFSLMCLMADQTLFSIVDWARTSIFFKQLKVRSCLLALGFELKANHKILFYSSHIFLFLPMVQSTSTCSWVLAFTEISVFNLRISIFCNFLHVLHSISTFFSSYIRQL